MDYFADPKFVAVFGVVVVSRFALPFTIFRWPLAGILACLVLDAEDLSIFQAFGYDPSFYQGYDKAMDVFYLSMAYIATLRNWASLPAFRIGRGLFFFRQVGVVAFELSGARWILFVFANVFEYFFIAYEAIRARWSPLRLALRGWVVAALAIWVFIKWPQEWWIHIAQLDFSDTWSEYAWFPPLVIGFVAIVALVAWRWVVPRLPAADHAWQLTAPPLPPEMDSAEKRVAFMTEYGRVWSPASLEKSALIGMLLVIFATLLPNVAVSPLRLMLWTSGFVLVNVALALAFVRRGHTNLGLAIGFILRLAVNLALLGAIELAFHSDLVFGDAAFFVLIFSVFVTAYDRYRPVYEWRRMQA